jgi:glycosyltransferase involved in cell wall biosynthesis
MRLMMLGPGLSVRGGVASVERLILANLPPRITTIHIPTMVDGTRARKLWQFIAAVLSTEAGLRRGVDLVHIHFSSRASSVRKEILARRAMRAGALVVMHAHGSEYQLYWQRMSAKRRARTLEVLSRSALLIVLGESWREFFASIGVPREKVAVMANPVRLPETVPDRSGRDMTVFLYLGIVNARKGAFDLLNAIQLLQDGVKSRSRFVVAGDGEYERLRQLVSQAGLSDTIEVTGWVDEQRRDELLRAADVFILPSHNEGLPMALLEAMAWGLPAICSPAGSISEVVSDGENGLLVTAGEPAGIAAAIERLAVGEAERLSMGIAARQSVQRLSVAQYMVRLCSLYDSLVRTAK